MKSNTLELVAHVIHVDELRYTPAGIPLLNLTLQHASEQIEANMRRRVECSVNAVIMGELAHRSKSIAVTTQVYVSGFIAKRSLKSTQLILHIQTLDIL